MSIFWAPENVGGGPVGPSGVQLLPVSVCGRFWWVRGRDNAALVVRAASYLEAGERLFEGACAAQ